MPRLTDGARWPPVASLDDVVLGGKQLERVSGIASRGGLIIAIGSFSAICVTLLNYFMPIYEAIPLATNRDYFLGQLLKTGFITFCDCLAAGYDLHSGLPDLYFSEEVRI
jgi:hypothetical protein